MEFYQNIAKVTVYLKGLNFDKILGINKIRCECNKLYVDKLEKCV